jgi:hypothetical protein
MENENDVISSLNADQANFFMNRLVHLHNSLVHGKPEMAWFEFGVLVERMAEQFRKEKA